jgi:hypothetical protein
MNVFLKKSIPFSLLLFCFGCSKMNDSENIYGTFKILYSTMIEDESGLLNKEELNLKYFAKSEVKILKSNEIIWKDTVLNKEETSSFYLQREKFNYLYLYQENPPRKILVTINQGPPYRSPRLIFYDEFKPNIWVKVTYFLFAVQ